MEEIRRRTPVPFLSEGEKEETWREKTSNEYGELNSPCPSLSPRARTGAVVPRIIAVVPLGRKYRAEAVVPLNQAAVKNYCRVVTVVPCSRQR